jgi:hypothetical protein
MFLNRTDENPFKMEDRKYPVDFGCPIEELYVLKLNVPLGYSILEKPDDMILKLPKDGGKFVYSVNQIGNKIQFLSHLTIKTTIYNPEEYNMLKMFYKEIIGKQQSCIILKKNLHAVQSNYNESK